MLELEFHSGTLILRCQELPAGLEKWCRQDRRIQAWRCSAGDYAPVVTFLTRNAIPYTDHAREYQRLQFDFRPGKEMRDYQREAVEAWEAARRRGVVVLPTGAGKSFVAQNAIVRAGRSTLVVVPTLDLLAQWRLQLRHALHCPIGALGGGAHDVQEVTVSTYDSALIHLERLGARFGMLVVDECHHLPGEAYSQIARLAIAPWRLGLTATPERTDGRHGDYPALLGDICYRREITQLSGDGSVLAGYETIPVDTELDPDEQEEYSRNRSLYVDFLHRNKISFSSPAGWQAFIRACNRQPDGREALKAYLNQRSIARSSRAKLRQLHQLIAMHRHERILIFTADNATAYRIGSIFALPVITHHTSTNERCDFLEAFRSGEFPVLVTSKVLNEGVDVPAANIGIVVSGSGSVREHVQRLGRILRPAPGKTALLYELISLGTGETYVSERRRQHPAYER